MSRVVLVGRGAPERGGIPTFLEQLARGVEGHEVVLLNLSNPDVREGGRLSIRNIRRTIADLGLVSRAAVDADVVHLHTALSAASTIARAGALAAACRVRRTPVLVHAHGGKLLTWLTPRRRPIVALALLPATRVVAVSRGLATALEPVVGRDRVVVVQNGVETDLFKPRPNGSTSDPPTVLYVGGLTRRKGLLDLIEASRRTRERGVDHRLVVIGGEPDEGREEMAIIREAAATADVDMRGSLPREELPAAYREADLFCLPSWWEAAPLSVLEAMASGLPVIATKVGDVPSMVVDGVTGRVVAPRDVDALTEALVEVLADGGKRSEWGAAGRTRVVERNSFDATRRAMAALYDDPSHAPGDLWR